MYKPQTDPLISNTLKKAFHPLMDISNLFYHKPAPSIWLLNEFEFFLKTYNITVLLFVIEDTDLHFRLYYQAILKSKRF